MPTNAAGVADAAPVKMRYSSTLRCIGQSLEAMELKSLEIKTHGDDFIVRVWNRGPSMAMDLESIIRRKIYVISTPKDAKSANRSPDRRIF